MDNHTVRQSDSETVIQSDNQTVRQLDNQAVRTAVESWWMDIGLICNNSKYRTVHIVSSCVPLAFFIHWPPNGRLLTVKPLSIDFGGGKLVMDLRPQEGVLLCIPCFFPPLCLICWQWILHSVADTELQQWPVVRVHTSEWLLSVTSAHRPGQPKTAKWSGLANYFSLRCAGGKTQGHNRGTRGGQTRRAYEEKPWRATNKRTI